MPIGFGTRAAATVLVSVAMAGCGAGGPTDANSSKIRVVIETLGSDLDVDGYSILVDGDVRYFTLGQPERLIDYLSPGTHTIALDQVAGNCSVQGTNPRSVTVAAFETAEVRLVVMCAIAAIELTVRTSGVFVPETFSVAIDTRPPVPVTPTDPVIIGRLTPGERVVTLVGNFDHCTISGGAQRTVDIELGATVPVSFDVTCVEPTRLERIAFASDTSIFGFTNASIILVNPDGSRSVSIASGHSPAWSPDGTMLVYSTTFCDFYYGTGCHGSLIVIDPETRNRVPFNGGQFGVSPAWSPQGDAIAYVRCCDFIVGNSSIYLATFDGKPDVEVRVLVSDAAYDPVWSPDGQRIVFSCASYQLPAHNLCVINRDGSDFAHLTNGGSSDRDPAWSPDGNQIAFTRLRDGVRRVAVMTLSDSSVRELGEGMDPTWSRDGTRLAFTTGDGIFVMNADGTGRRRLTSSPHYAPAWRP